MGSGGRGGSAAGAAGQQQAEAGSKRKAFVKERARAKKQSRKAEREGGSDDERLQDGSAFAADFADPRFKVGLPLPSKPLRGEPSRVDTSRRGIPTYVHPRKEE